MGTQDDKNAGVSWDDVLFGLAVIIIVVFALGGALGFLNPPPMDCVPPLEERTDHNVG